MDSVAYILEHPQFPDEPVNDQYSSNIMEHDSLIHIYSKDWFENYELVRRFQNIVDTFAQSNGISRLLI